MAEKLDDAKLLVTKILTRKRVRDEPLLESGERQMLVTYIRANCQNHSISELSRLMRFAIGIKQNIWAKHLGTSPFTIKSIESGKANPTLKTLNAMGKLFGLKIAFVAK